MMKVSIKLFATIFLLVSTSNVLAEGNWRFGLEVGSPWIECGAGYTGSTADALGCSATSLSNSSVRFNVSKNDLKQQGESLKLTANTTNSKPIKPSFDDAATDSKTFWTMDNGLSLDYGQVLVSAMLKRPQNDQPADPLIEIPPYEPGNEEAITALMSPR